MTAVQTEPALRARALVGHMAAAHRVIPRGAVLAADDPAVRAQPHLFLIAENVNDVEYDEARRAYGRALAEQVQERDDKNAAKAEKKRKAERAKVEQIADQQQVGFVAKLAAGRIARRERAEAERVASERERRELAARTEQRRKAEAAGAELQRRQAAGELDAEVERIEAELAAGAGGGTGEA